MFWADHNIYRAWQTSFLELQELLSCLLLTELHFISARSCVQQGYSQRQRLEVGLGMGVGHHLEMHLDKQKQQLLENEAVNRCG